MTTDKMILRVCLGILATSLVLLAFLLLPERSNSSTDGREHTCGLVTEQGVTEHLSDYWERCGKSTP